MPRKSKLSKNLAARTTEHHAARKARKLAKPRKDSQGGKFSRDERLLAGKRPRGMNPAKKDVWKDLTPSQRENILAKSRAHMERQRIMGIPEELWYGPAMVIERAARWDERLSTTTLVDTV